MLLFERLADPADRSLLVEASGDVGIDLDVGEASTGVAPLHHELEFVPGAEPCGLTGRRHGVVPDPGLEPVRVEDDRPTAVHRLQCVGVQLRLVLTDGRIPSGPLGLDERERRSVVAPQHVVDAALTGLARHSGDLEFAVASSVEAPSGFAERQVDEEVARFGLGVVVIVGHGGGASLRHLHVCSEPLDLGGQRCVLLGELPLALQCRSVGGRLCLELADPGRRRRR